MPKKISKKPEDGRFKMQGGNLKGAVTTLGRLMKNYPTKMRMLIAGIGESLPAITEVDDTFGIMKLPAEIRNKIYFELLVANRSIVIKRSTNGSARHSKKRPRSPSKRKYNITAYIESDRGFREPDKASLKREHPSAVLLANKSIRREARQIFYGANTFIFLDSLALFEFLMRSGSNFAFLKNIKVVNLNFHYAFHLRRSLMALKAPTRVDLTVGNTPSKEPTPAAIATWMWQDVVKHFVERRAEWRDHDDDSEDDREERNSAKAAGPSAERKVYQGGVYIKYPIVCVKKQEKRFNTLVFGYTPDQWFKIGERAAIQTFAVLERWEQEMRPFSKENCHITRAEMRDWYSDESEWSEYSEEDEDREASDFD